MTSEIRANTIKNRVGLGTVSFTNTGPVVSGIVTANTLRLPDSTSGSLGRVQLGNGLDLSLFHNGSNSFLINNTGYLSIQSQDGVNGIFIARNAEVNLYFGSSVRLQTSSSGVTINRDLDVDGHTNLDNVSVAGVSTFTGSVTAHDYRSGGGVGNTLYLTSADDWRFRTTGGAERLRIDSSGKLGVGDFSSTSIAQALHVRGSQPQIYLEHTGGYDLTLTTNDGMGQNGITVNGGFLSLAYNNKNIVMCRTGGNIGINSTSPANKLDVALGAAWIYPDEDGTEAIALKLGKLADYNTSLNDILVADNDGSSSPTYQVTNKINRYIAKWHFDRVTAPGATRINAFQLKSEDSGGNLGNAFIIRDLKNTADSIKLWTNGNSFVGVTTDGTTRNFGIGTNNPTYPLHIKSGSGGDGTVTFLELNHGGNQTNDAVKLNFARAGGDIGSIVLEKVASNNTTDFIFNTRSYNTVSESMRITGAGKVGIGIDNPDELLHIFSSTSNSKIVLESDNNSANNGIFWVDENDATQSEFYYSHPDNKQFLKVNGNGFEIYSKQTSSIIAKIGHGTGYNDMILSNGNFGIGIDDPAAKLEAYGTDAAITVHNSGNSRGGIAAFTNQRLAFVSTHVNDDLVFGYSNNPPSTANLVERMRIDNGTGNVVIGHTAANAKLHIASGTSSAVGDATNPAFQIGNTANYRFAIHTTNEQAIIANKNGDDGIAFHTKTAGGSSFGQALLIDANNNLKHGTTTPTAFTGSDPNHTQRFLGKKCMQGCITATVTLDSNGNGTFDLGKIWLVDDSSCELFIQVVRNDAASYTTHYAKGFIQKVRGSGMSQAHILYQNGAASGFSISSLFSGGYTGSGHSSHGTRLSVTGGAGGVIYRTTCFYTAISKNDMY